MTTLVTAAEIAKLRRMVAEPDSTTYSNDVLVGYIETYPHMDENGQEPFILSGDLPPVHTTNTEWMPTYDLNAAAADIWDEKAALWVAKYDFSADGGNYSVSKVYDQMVAKARYHRSRRMPTTLLVKSDVAIREDVSYIGNLPEPLDN